ncbi:unnamed protein product [Penicillium pancosmium]
MTDILRSAHGGHGVIRTESSFSSISTAVAESDFKTNQSIKNSDQSDEKLRVQSKVWPMEDELSSSLQRENARRSDDGAVAYSNSPRMREPNSIAEGDAYIPTAELWGIGVSQILELGPTNTARKLADASFDKFARLPFGEFVQEARERHSEIIYDHLWAYNLLGEKLYFDFVRASNHLDQLFQVKEGLEEIEADPFIRATVDYAWTKAVFLRLQKPQDKAWENRKANYLSSRLGDVLNKLVIQPLKRIIERPHSALKIQQDLKIMEARFRRTFMPLNVHWHSPFQVSTQFADEVRCSDPWTIAQVLTSKDKLLFKTYIAVAVEEDGSQARSILNARWNELMAEVSECLIARIGLEATIDDIVHGLYRLRNYYSMAAIIHGIRESGLQMESLGRYGQLFNPASNYQFYRNFMGTGNALHFLRPTFTALKFGDKKYAAVAVGDFANIIHFNTVYSLEPGEHGYTSQLEETASVGYSFFNVLSKCFGF